MPRNISGVYFLPPGSEAVPLSVIAAENFNNTIGDIANDLNEPRPITAGGTGATTVAGARANILAGSVSNADVAANAAISGSKISYANLGIFLGGDIYIDKTAGQTKEILGRVGTFNSWSISLGDANNDFKINRFDETNGTYLDSPLTIGDDGPTVNIQQLRVIEPGFPAWGGIEGLAVARFHAFHANGSTRESAISAVATNGDAVPFVTEAPSDTIALSAWTFRGASGTNHIVSGNIGSRIQSVVAGKVNWALEVDSNNEGGDIPLGSTHDPIGIVLNHGSTYSPNTGIHIRRAGGEGTGPGWKRGILIDGARERGVEVRAMTVGGLVPAAPGTIAAYMAGVEGESNLRFQIDHSGVMQWGNGASAYQCSLFFTDTGGLSTNKNFNLNTSALSYLVNGINVVGSRKTGWGTPTGTATRTAFDTSTVTLSQLAERLKALIDDLRAHGLIGT